MTKPAKKETKKTTKPTRAPAKSRAPVEKQADLAKPGEAFEAFHKANAPTPESHPELFDIFGNRL